MSSPAGSLKKTRRSPLPLAASFRSVPFRQSTPINDPLDVENCRSSRVAGGTHGRIVDAIRREGERHGAPSDGDLVASMATRLAQVERELLAARREILDKDNTIRQLEDQAAILNLKASSSSGELQQRCLALQDQIDEMEEFLNDYGMVWVGKERRVSESHHWKPSDSVVTSSNGSFAVDFDTIIKNVQELNVLAGEGTTHIKHTNKGAHLTTPPPVPLTLYHNGIVMFAGPFRPYSDPSTQQCIQDLTDGYFPNELQQRYPEGVPFKLLDKREIEYHARWGDDEFPGSGQRLGANQSTNTRSVTTITHQDYPQQLSVDSFLSRLPKVVMKEGRVIDIRNGLAETLKGSAGQVTLVDTPVVQELRDRLEHSSDGRPPTPSLVTLKIKSENGNETYILKLRGSNSVGDIRTHINQLRSPSHPHNYLIYCSYPRRALTNDSASLEQCCLSPSANLFLAKERNKPH